MKHLIGTASAAGVALGLALFASTAYAGQGGEGDRGPGAPPPSTANSYNTDSQNTTVPISDSLNDSSTSNKDSYNSTSVPINDAGNDQSTRHSYNDNSKGSHNDNSQSYTIPISDSGNTYKDSHDNNSINDSGNTMRNHHDNNSINDSGNLLKNHHDNNSVNDSGNTTMTIGDVSLALSSTDLKGSVSGQTFDARHSGTGVSSGQLTFSGDAMQGYAGITNANYVTGQGSLGQAANSVTATSSISFR